ncbi:FecR family protein [Hydrogenophaga sp. PAMC20947]|uniref:FecR family protein n=1 Tax=Hydrogenophaga sp. PAMC20947 TaxID=2565558 RepID=UPI00109E03FC|nr:FecR family protein [Hydrogenophaga sp. PAMC20947]QCB45455.1 hypothetical protein E5678_05090 [Hydrogenophaga sp. PAMC20947]
MPAIAASGTPFQRLVLPGTRLHRRMMLSTIAALALVTTLSSLSPVAHAATPTETETVIEAVQVPAWVERNGQRRPAQPGQRLRANDKAVTAEGSRMLLRLSDRSVIKLGEKTEFLIETLAEKQQGVAGPSEITSVLRLITGVFRYATDYTSKALGHTRNINLKLATATVGIRGTDFWSMTDSNHDAVCLFEGRVVVERDQRPDIELGQPGAFWVTRTGQSEQPAGQATPRELMKFIAQAELKAGTGVLLEGGRWRTVAGLHRSAGAGSTQRDRLQAAGYPADMVEKQGRYEVRINDLATQADAQSVLARLQADDTLGVATGRVALAAR